MCTLTFIPLKNGFVLTSNRDEQVFRATLKPNFYAHQKQQFFYSKDEVANGSWIAVSNQRKLASLLNGGFEKYERKAHYAKSRGLILLESLEANSFNGYVNKVDLKEIEPFTLLLLDFKKETKMLQLVWDGNQKFIEKVDISKPRIWSSAALYSKANRLLRQQWFDEWLNQFEGRADYDILNFHKAKHSEKSSINILMKGENQLQTVSISQIKVQNNDIYFLYEDLKEDSKSNTDLSNWMK